MAHKRFIAMLAVALLIVSGDAWGQCEANLDGNDRIDFADFLLFARAYGTPDADADMDGDGVVGFSDFLRLADQFNSRCFRQTQITNTGVNVLTKMVRAYSVTPDADGVTITADRGGYYVCPPPVNGVTDIRLCTTYVSVPDVITLRLCCPPEHDYRPTVELRTDTPVALPRLQYTHAQIGLGVDMTQVPALSDADALTLANAMFNSLVDYPGVTATRQNRRAFSWTNPEADFITDGSSFSSTYYGVNDPDLDILFRRAATDGVLTSVGFWLYQSRGNHAYRGTMLESTDYTGFFLDAQAKAEIQRILPQCRM